ncbi:hypothetical protein ACLOJK_028192 [Asimina triloba]
MNTQNPQQPHTRDRFGMSDIMEEEERRNIISTGKHPKEAAVEQALWEVLKPDTPIPSEWELEEEWELMEEAGAKARGIARMDTERERCRTEGMAKAS